MSDLEDDLSRALRPLRYRPGSAERYLEAYERARRPKPRRRGAFVGAFVAAIAVAACVLLYFRIRHPEEAKNKPSDAILVEGVVAAEETNGQWLETIGHEATHLKLAGLGVVAIDPGSRLRVIEHRLELAHGAIDVSVDAPPRVFVVGTPTSDAVDLGCQYLLTADEDATTIAVTRGWVSLEGNGRVAKIPAGAAAKSKKGIGPGAPYWPDASEAFRKALLDYDFANGGDASLAVVLAESRARDTLTLVTLAQRATPEIRAKIFERIVALVPAPPGITPETLVHFDEQNLDDLGWKQSLQAHW